MLTTYIHNVIIIYNQKLSLFIYFDIIILRGSFDESMLWVQHMPKCG